MNLIRIAVWPHLASLFWLKPLLRGQQPYQHQVLLWGLVCLHSFFSAAHIG